MTGDIETVAFRVDSSEKIGTGHFMRCLTLAAALKRVGARCHFVCRHALDHLQAMAVEAGHGFDLLESTPIENSGGLVHSAWLGTSQETDARQTFRALSGDQWDWLVVDHYALDACWESALRSAVPNILVIDDLADRQHDCTALLDQNLYPDMDTRYCGKVPSHCRVLLGPSYALLREEFRKLRDNARVRQGNVSRILVMMGGVDAVNDTAKAIRAIARLRDRSFLVDVIVGEGHPARDALQAMCKDHGFQLHVQTADVALFMAAADLAIGAAGSSSWERCCMGLPTICISQAAHQLRLAEGLESRGAVVNLGDSAGVSDEDLASALSSLIEQPAHVAALSVAAARLVDGKGAERVSQRLMGAK